MKSLMNVVMGCIGIVIFCTLVFAAALAPSVNIFLILIAGVLGVVMSARLVYVGFGW